MENNQPSEWAMKKAIDMTGWLMNPLDIDHSDPLGESKAHYKQSADMARIIAKELDSLKSQADELERALEKLKQFHQGGHSEARIIIEEALSKYRKGEGK